MTTDDFQRLALSLPGAEQGSHFGATDFRVGGRIFATLAAADKGYGNLMLTPEEQANFITELPETFLPVPGGWGRNGATHVRLDKATEDVLEGALRVAWKLRVDKNAATQRSKTAKVRSKRADNRNG
jgi:hypothetical protein